MERIYLDHNATSPLRPEARAALVGALDQLRGNPSSLHAAGRAARQMLDEARERTAAALAVHEDELVFTSGGTESNNLALLGALRARGASFGLATTAIEHSSVLAPARELEREGRPLWVVGVDREARLDVARLLEAAADPRCVLVSVMAANNEIGVCPPLDEVGSALGGAGRRPLFHVDAVQALGRIELRLRERAVDLASFSAHKVGGPVGVGVLYRRQGVALKPLMYGGEQENGLRPGTENVAGIVAASVAIECAVRERAANAARLREVARDLWGELKDQLSRLTLLGPPLDDASRLPGTLNVLARGEDGKVLVMRLDLEGIECSAGSACASGSIEPSHVLRAIGLDDDDARAGLRLSIGRDTPWKGLRQAVDILGRTLGRADATSGDAVGL
jgi:cysteine desulfurase